MHKIIMALGAVVALSGCVERIDANIPTHALSIKKCRDMGGDKLSLAGVPIYFRCYRADGAEIRKWTPDEIMFEAYAVPVK